MSDQTQSAPLSIGHLIARILEFLVAEPGRVARFFNVTGLTAETVRDAASAPGFAAVVPDHILGDEPLLQRFAAEAVCGPRTCFERWRGWRGNAKVRRRSNGKRLRLGPLIWRGGSR